MVTYTTGNIFKSEAEALANPVNCEGVSGAGLALQFKQRYPENYSAYYWACQRVDVYPGNSFVFHNESSPRWIINFPTKRAWRDVSLIRDIEEGLKELVLIISAYRITSIAIPPLGCGLGGLDWAQVKPLVETYLGGISDVKVVVYEPA